MDIDGLMEQPGEIGKILWDLVVHKPVLQK